MILFFVEIVADKSKYEKRFLKTGISDGIYTEIIEGVDSTSLIKKYKCRIVL